MNKKINILHLEDSIKDSELICSVIDKEKIGYDYFLADNEKDFKYILETKKIDIILCDYSLPDFDGYDALKVARVKYSQMPFIFVSGTMGEDTAADALINGATDYVVKNKLDRLVPAIKRALNNYEVEVEHKQTEAALRESERKYKDLINQLNDGYFVTNNNGIITYANISLAKMLGFNSPEELKGHSFAEFSKDSNAHGVTNSFKTIIENKKKVDVLEMEMLRIDRNSIHIEINAVPVMEDNEITGMQGVIHDITERKRAEINLKEKNKQIEAQNIQYFQINKELAFQNEEKKKRAADLIITNKKHKIEIKEKEKSEPSNKELEAFINSVSHDLRAPLRNVISIADFLIKNNSSQLDETGLKYLKTISESSLIMENRVDELLTLSKLNLDRTATDKNKFKKHDNTN